MAVQSRVKENEDEGYILMLVLWYYLLIKTNNISIFTDTEAQRKESQVSISRSQSSKTSNAARSHRSAWHEKEVKKRKFLQGCASLRSPKMNATNNINNKKRTASHKSSPPKPHLPSSDLITKKENNTTLLDSIINLLV